MISPESLQRLAKMQGYPDDVSVQFSEPTVANQFAHTLVAQRGPMCCTKCFLFGAPTLGEIAKTLSEFLVGHAWLQ